MELKKTQGILIGSLVFLFGMIGLYLGWDMITGFYDLMESTLLKIIWVIGLVGIIGINIVLIPLMFILGGTNISWIQSLKGLFYFIIGSLCSFLAYFIIPPVIETITGFTEFGDFGIISQLGWIILIIFWILSLIFYPIFTALKGGVPVN